MINTLAATLACWCWEQLAWHRRQRHHFVPWSSEQLAEYLEATERYSGRATTAQREETRSYEQL